jgi:hypothetical protein
MESGEAIPVGALYTRAHPFSAYRADLTHQDGLTGGRLANRAWPQLTSFHRFLGICSTPSTGSM